MTYHADVVICGAGNAGVAAAYYLATHHQITNILLVDKNPPLSQTSAKSGENIRTWWPVQPMIDLAERSMALMEELAANSNNAFNLEKRGYAYVTADRASLKPYLAHYSTLDVGGVRIHSESTAPGQYVPPSQPNFDDPISGADVLQRGSLLSQIFPHFAPNVEAVVHARRAGSVSAQQLGMLMLAEIQSVGAKMLRGEVVEIEVVSGRVGAIQIQTEAGIQRIVTAAIINAAGPFASHVAQMMEISLPIQTIFQQKIAFQDTVGLIPRAAPFTIYLDKQYIDWSDEERRDLEGDPDLAWLLEEFPGGLHIKPEGTGESTWIKLGWAYNEVPENPEWEPDTWRRAPEFPDVMLRGASRLVPALRQYVNNIPKPLLHYGGYYTKTEENLPLVGPLAVEGAFIVGALSGFGTMMSCATGELIASWVAGSTRPSYANLFSLGRYQDRKKIETLKTLARQGEL